MILQQVWQMCIFSLIALAANFDNGFSSTYLNTPVDEFKDYLNRSLTKKGHEMTESTYNWIWNLILNIWFVGFFIGIWFSPILNDKFGRKVGYIIGNFFALIGAILRYLAMVLLLPELLFAGRIITSICIAITFQSCILFLQECSPTKMRGLMSFLSEISLAIMCLVGTLLGTQQVMGNHLSAFLLFPVPFCAFFFFILFFLHETPKFLLLEKGNRKAAMESIRFYHGNDADVEEILEEIILESADEKVKDPAWQLIREIFTEFHLRKALVLSCCCLQNTIAWWSILLSSTYFLKEANVNSSLAAWSTTGMTLAYALGTLLGSTLIEKVGRRGLFLTFTTLNNLLLLMFVVCSLLQPVVDFLKYGSLVALILYGLTYGIGVGPISWFISSELVPQRYRSLTQSICYATNTLMVVITTFSILPLYNVIGSYAFLILYSAPSSVCLFYLFIHLPETKGKEIHEIVRDLIGKYNGDFVDCIDFV